MKANKLQNKRNNEFKNRKVLFVNNNGSIEFIDSRRIIQRIKDKYHGTNSHMPSPYLAYIKSDNLTTNRTYHGIDYFIRTNDNNDLNIENEQKSKNTLLDLLKLKCWF